MKQNIQEILRTSKDIDCFAPQVFPKKTEEVFETWKTTPFDKNPVPLGGFSTGKVVVTLGSPCWEFLGLHDYWWDNYSN